MDNTTEPQERQRKTPAYLAGFEKFAMVPTNALPRIKQLSDLKVYCVLVAHANAVGWCHPSRSTIARMAGFGNTTIVSKALKRLEAAGVILIDERPGTANRYNIVPPVDYDFVAQPVAPVPTGVAA